MVERWFAEITRKRIRRGTYRSLPDLIRTIEEHVTHDNRHAEPFIWTATAASILMEVRHCKEALKTAHEGCSMSIHYRLAMRRPGYDGNLALARTGSTTLTKLMRKIGMPNTHHNHALTVSDMYEKGARNLLSTIRPPDERFQSGHSRRLENHVPKKHCNQEYRKRFKTVNDFVDTLRRSDDANHQWARDALNDPTNQAYTIPVSSYYLMSPDDRRKNDVTITWLSTRSLISDFEQATGYSVSTVHKKRSKPHAAAKLGAEQLEWLKSSDLYRADFDLYERVCAKRDGAVPVRTNGAGELLIETEI